MSCMRCMLFVSHTSTGCRQLVIRGCLLQGECAVEVYGNARVRLENCVMISSAAQHYTEDDMITPWNRYTHVKHIAYLVSHLCHM